MATRDEVNFTSDWFLKRYIKTIKPIPEREDGYTLSQLYELRGKSDLLIGFIFTGNEGVFSDQKIDICVNNFGNYPNIINDRFNKEEVDTFPQGVGGASALIRLAPFFLLPDDSLDIFFELSENECLTERSNPSLILPGCNIVIFEYDNNHENALIIYDAMMYENKADRFMIINGNAFAEIIKVNKDFLKKSLPGLTYVPNDSKTLKVIRNNPRVIISISPYLRDWLFKQTPITSLKKQAGLAGLLQ